MYFYELIFLKLLFKSVSSKGTKNFVLTVLLHVWARFCISFIISYSWIAQCLCYCLIYCLAFCTIGELHREVIHQTRSKLTETYSGLYWSWKRAAYWFWSVFTKIRTYITIHRQRRTYSYSIKSMSLPHRVLLIGIWQAIFRGGKGNQRFCV